MSDAEKPSDATLAESDFQRTADALNDVSRDTLGAVPGTQLEGTVTVWDDLTVEEIERIPWERDKDPISGVAWIHTSQLDANAYNPNVVFRAELKLLERSILRTGWVQPILVSPVEREIVGDGGQPEMVTRYRIIDGFHRSSLSRDSAKLNARYKGMVPVAILNIDEAEAMIMTVRMNRAKGSHVALRMADLVKELIDTHGLTLEQICPEMGMTMEEAKLLYQNSAYKARKLDKAPYANAWTPYETRKHGNVPQVASRISKTLRHRPYEEVDPSYPRPIVQHGEDVAEKFDDESAYEPDEALEEREREDGDPTGSLQ